MRDWRIENISGIGSQDSHTCTLHKALAFRRYIYQVKDAIMLNKSHENRRRRKKKDVITTGVGEGGVNRMNYALLPCGLPMCPSAGSVTGILHYEQPARSTGGEKKNPSTPYSTAIQIQILLDARGFSMGSSSASNWTGTITRNLLHTGPAQANHVSCWFVCEFLTYSLCSGITYTRSWGKEGKTKPSRNQSTLHTE